MTTLPTEFNDAVPIEKQHRFAIAKTDTGAELWFGLLGTDGQVRYFRIPSDGATRLGIDMHELARTTKYLAHGLPAPGPSYAPEDLPLAADGFVAPFIGPQMKFHRALVHFNDLDDIIYLFSKKVKMTAKQIEVKATSAIWEIGFSDAPPAAIPLMLGDSIHNLRSALDFVITDIARTRNVKGRLAFPFGDSEATLKKQFREKRELNSLGADVLEAILALKPFKENGNALLWALHELDNADKHRVALATTVAAWHQWDLGEFMSDAAVNANPSMERPRIAVLDDGTLTDVRLKKGDRIERPVGQDPLHYYRPHDQMIEVAFSSASTTLAGQPIVPVLHDLIQLVQKILIDFDAKFNPAHGKS